MNIQVEYKDTAGTITNQTHRLTRLAFAKHLAIAGQGYAPRPQNLFGHLLCFFITAVTYNDKHLTTTDFQNHQFNYLTQQKKDNFQTLRAKQLQTFSPNELTKAYTQ